MSTDSTAIPLRDQWVPSNVLEREFDAFNSGQLPPWQKLSRQSSRLFGDDTPIRVAVIGGGIAGTTITLGLCEANRLIADGERSAVHPVFAPTLFEAGDSLVDGPPFCHLHAGGNLYRGIPDDSCVVLLRQCIDICRIFPHAIEKRPTVELVPISDTMKSPEQLMPRLQLLQETYASIVASGGPTFAVLGPPENYYQLYMQVLDELTHMESFFNDMRNNGELQMMTVEAAHCPSQRELTRDCGRQTHGRLVRARAACWQHSPEDVSSSPSS